MTRILRVALHALAMSAVIACAGTELPSETPTTTPTVPSLDGTFDVVAAFDSITYPVGAEFSPPPDCVPYYPNCYVVRPAAGTSLTGTMTLDGTSAVGTLASRRCRSNGALRPLDCSALADVPAQLYGVGFVGPTSPIGGSEIDLSLPPAGHGEVVRFYSNRTPDSVYGVIALAEGTTSTVGVSYRGRFVARRRR